MRKRTSAPLQSHASKRRAEDIPRLSRRLPVVLAAVATSLTLTAVDAEVSPRPLPVDRLEGRGAQSVHTHHPSRAGKEDPAPTHPRWSRPRSVPSPPAYAFSHYLTKTRRSYLDRLGCRQGWRVRRSESLRDAVTVLAFGRPVKKHGRYGASLFGHRFAGMNAIKRAAKAYTKGYERCARRDEGRLTLALGTSNFGRQVSYRHGQRWALMVNAMNRWVEARGFDRVTVTGANDIELAWNGPHVTRRWVAGYESAAGWPYYNFGDAGNCPPAGNCHGRWTQEDVWYVSWGAPSAWPLPQIYTKSGSQAQQWYRLSLYSHKRHGQRMTIMGAISQRTACRQTPDPCRGMNNSPRYAWRQLWSVLNRDPRTSQPIQWSTDLRWSK